MGMGGLAWGGSVVGHKVIKREKQPALEEDPSRARPGYLRDGARMATHQQYGPECHSWRDTHSSSQFRTVALDEVRTRLFVGRTLVPGGHLTPSSQIAHRVLRMGLVTIMATERIIVGASAIVIGSFAALWRLRLARFILDRQNAFWGSRFGGRTLVATSYLVLIWALALAAYGMAVIAGFL